MSNVNDTPRPRLGPHSRLVIRREGGLAHFPGLAAPRCIEGGECTPGQRRWLESLLAVARECGTPDVSPSEAMPAGADRRIFHLTVDEPDATASEASHDTLQPSWALVIDESRAPASLVTLWRHGELGEESDDE